MAASMGAAFTALLFSGTELLPAAAIAVAGTAGGIEVGYRLTLPHVAPRVSIVVLILVLAVIVYAVWRGHPAPESVLIVLAAAWCTAEAARRLTGRLMRPAEQRA